MRPVILPLECVQVNCVLFGRQGNGKSSLINSVYQTVTDTTAKLCEEVRHESL